MEPIDAILMASGFSARFGKPNKLLQPFQGKPLVWHTLNLVTNTGVFSHVYFVYANPELIQIASSFPVICIHNNAPQKGQRESIRLGVETSNALHYMFFPCDQPLLTKEIIQEILAKRGNGRIIMPRTANAPKSPALFSSAFRRELLSLKEGENARIIPKRHPDSVIYVDVADPFLLADVDTPADLTSLQLQNQEYFTQNE